MQNTGKEAHPQHTLIVHKTGIDLQARPNDRVNLQRLPVTSLGDDYGSQEPQCDTIVPTCSQTLRGTVALSGSVPDREDKTESNLCLPQLAACVLSMILYCSAGPVKCNLNKWNEPQVASHICEHLLCPSRNLGLHNLCNYLGLKPNLMPQELASIGPEATFFCSESCIVS
eukprot:gb/GEZJ01005874.1/.p1 GENE.gb/GEZJ01005874.1/~~gb/GEZJ01005874.1/.p1  ORF type:complete len:171 (-),score=7.96 gb/GEZJ01005874.1/:293-805(-)